MWRFRSTTADAANRLIVSPFVRVRGCVCVMEGGKGGSKYTLLHEIVILDETM